MYFSWPFTSKIGGSEVGLWEMFTLHNFKTETAGKSRDENGKKSSSVQKSDTIDIWCIHMCFLDFYLHILHKFPLFF